MSGPTNRALRPQRLDPARLPVRRRGRRDRRSRSGRRPGSSTWSTSATCSSAGHRARSAPARPPPAQAAPVETAPVEAPPVENVATPAPPPPPPPRRSRRRRRGRRHVRPTPARPSSSSRPTPVYVPPAAPPPPPPIKVEDDAAAASAAAAEAAARAPANHDHALPRRGSSRPAARPRQPPTQPNGQQQPVPGNTATPNRTVGPATTTAVPGQPQSTAAAPGPPIRRGCAACRRRPTPEPEPPQVTRSLDRRGDNRLPLAPPIGERAMAKKLTYFILAGLVLGILAGWAINANSDARDVFTPGAGGDDKTAALADRSPAISRSSPPSSCSLIKMIIAPLVFSTLVAGIAHMGDTAALGRVGVQGDRLVHLRQPGLADPRPDPRQPAAARASASISRCRPPTPPAGSSAPPSTCATSSPISCRNR